MEGASEPDHLGDHAALERHTQFTLVANAMLAAFNVRRAPRIVRSIMKYGVDFLSKYHEVRFSHSLGFSTAHGHGLHLNAAQCMSQPTVWFNLSVSTVLFQYVRLCSSSPHEENGTHPPWHRCMLCLSELHQLLRQQCDRWWSSVTPDTPMHLVTEAVPTRCTPAYPQKYRLR